MYDARRVVPGLLVFLIVATLPIWVNAARGAEPSVPSIEKPAGTAACVLDQPTMRVEHMRLLMTWRDEVVRTGARMYVTADGRRIRKSLTGTCLGCHKDKAASCDRCHTYVNVHPYCFDCHADKGGAQR